MCHEDIEEGGGLREICISSDDPVSRVARNATETEHIGINNDVTNITLIVGVIISVALMFSITAGLLLSRC